MKFKLEKRRSAALKTRLSWFLTVSEQGETDGEDFSLNKQRACTSSDSLPAWESSKTEKGPGPGVHSDAQEGLVAEEHPR